MKNREEVFVGTFLLILTGFAALSGSGPADSGVVIASVLAIGLASGWIVALFAAFGAVCDLILFGAGALAALRALALALLWTLALFVAVALALSGAGIWAGPLAAGAMIIHGIYRREQEGDFAESA